MMGSYLWISEIPVWWSSARCVLKKAIYDAEGLNLEQSTPKIWRVFPSGKTETLGGTYKMCNQELSWHQLEGIKDLGKKLIIDPLEDILPSHSP